VQIAGNKKTPKQLAQKRFTEGGRVDNILRRTEKPVNEKGVGIST